MSFGTLFLAPDSRPKSNLAKVLDDLIDVEIKSKVKKPDLQLDKSSQALGRLFGVGTDSLKVKAHILNHNEKKCKMMSSYFDDEMQSANSKRKQATAKTAHALTITEALKMDNQREGGKYYFNSRFNPYEVAVVNEPSDSVYNANTPKMWPANTLYPNSNYPQNNVAQSSTNQTAHTHSHSSPNSHKTLKKTLSSSDISQKILHSSSAKDVVYSSRPCSRSKLEQIIRETSSSAEQINQEFGDLDSHFGSKNNIQISTDDNDSFSEISRYSGDSKISQIASNIKSKIDHTLQTNSKNNKSSSNSSRLYGEQDMFGASNFGVSGSLESMRGNKNASDALERQIESMLVDSKYGSKGSPSSPQNHHNNLNHNHNHNSNHTHNQSGNSIGINNISALSALQSTLVQCGKLSLIDTAANTKQNNAIDDALKLHRGAVKQHAKWLQQNIGHGVGDSGDGSPSGGKVKMKSDNSGSSRKGKKDGDLESLQSSISGMSDLYSAGERELRRSKHNTSNNHNATDKLLRNINELSNSTDQPYINDNNISSYKNSGRLVNFSSDKSDKQSKKSDKTKQSNGTSLTKHTNTSNSSATSQQTLMQTAQNSTNPYRNNSIIRRRTNNQNITYCRSIAKPVNTIDPHSYADDIYIKSMNNFNICIKPSLQINEIPSQLDINNTITKLTRKTILTYNTRIIETASLLKALKNPKLVTPGMQAIFELHKIFIQSAAMNPNSWCLTRKQIHVIIVNYVPWIDSDTVSRLLIAFDPQNTGMIRYIRISITLLCCSQPAMIDLANTLNRVRNKIYKHAIEFENKQNNSDNSSTKSTAASMFSKNSGKNSTNINGDGSSQVSVGNSLSAHNGSQSTKSAAPDDSGDGELILITLMYSMYEQTAGGGLATQSNAPTTMSLNKRPTLQQSAVQQEVRFSYSDYMNNVGMKLEDVVEMCSCCVTCIEDEIEIDLRIKPLTQHLFMVNCDDDTASAKTSEPSNSNKEGTADSSTRYANMFNTSSIKPIDKSIQVETLLKHPLLKSIQPIPHITQEQLLSALKTKHRDFLHVFVRQVKTFRDRALPYILNKEAVTIEDSMSMYSSVVNSDPYAGVEL